MVTTGSEERDCICSPKAVHQYINKISGPLLDRIDIQLEVQRLKYENIMQGKDTENSENIKTRVNIARNMQRDRYKNDGIYSNSELTPKLIKKYCKLSSNAENILKIAYQRLGLSARGYSKILKVARTIADLEGKEQIKEEHIAEAIQYRNLDKKYWNSGSDVK